MERITNQMKNKCFFIIFVFQYRLHNKGVYVRAGLRKMTKRSSICLSDEIELEVDGKQIALPSVCGLVFLNIGRFVHTL